MRKSDTCVVEMGLEVIKGAIGPFDDFVMVAERVCRDRASRELGGRVAMATFCCGHNWCRGGDQK